MGRPGSGKTSSSGKALGDAIVGIPGSGGLILSSAPTDLAMWQAIFAAHGRSGDLILFGPTHPHRFDLAEYFQYLNFDSRQTAKALTTIGESLDNDDSMAGGGAADKFWPIQTKITLETAIEIVRQAEGTLHLPSLQKFVITAAQSAADLKSDAWRATSYHNQCFHKAYSKNPTGIERSEMERAWDRWLVQWPVMNDRTRTSIKAGVTGLLDVFNQGVIRSLLSSGTTITPDVMDRGKFIFFDMSVGQYGSSGAFAMNCMRYATQQYVTRRIPGQWKNPISIWLDEAGKLANSHDSTYLTESRKFGGLTVMLAQSTQSFHAALAGERGRSQAELLLGCFATKIVHAIGDPGTAEWLSKSLGNEMTYRGSMPGGGQQDDQPFGTSRMGWSESMAPCLEPRAFMHGLKTGGRADGFVSQAHVLKSGATFSNGQSHMLCSFAQ